jgi:hypothetical protein
MDLCLSFFSVTIVIKRGPLMKKLVLTYCAVGGIAFSLIGSAQATPINTLPLAGATPHASENIQLRRCWSDNGRRVCRYGFGYRDNEWRGYRHRDRDHRWHWRRGRDRD